MLQVTLCQAQKEVCRKLKLLLTRPTGARVRLGCNERESANKRPIAFNLNVNERFCRFRRHCNRDGLRSSHFQFL